MSAHQNNPFSIAKVLLPKPFGEAFDYRIPETMDLSVGHYVLVPFGRDTLWGVVWSLENHTTLKETQIKTIQEVSPLPPLPGALRHLLEWVASYTLSPLGSVLKMTLSTPEALKETFETVYTQITEPDFKLSAPRQRILEALKKESPLPRKKLIEVSSASVIKGLLEKGVIKERLEKTQDPEPAPLHFQPCTLNTSQQEAANAFCDAIKKGDFHPFVLDGVTGSGKTEVYFEGIKAAYDMGKQSLILVPEIALSTQWIDRFKQRFSVMPTLWHSDLSPSQRRTAWRSIATGQAKVVIGARSALFLPYKNLGYIVVDEEHDHSYKQETGVVYQGRDVAVMRAYQEKCPITLASATPSLETLHNINNGKYMLLHLPERHGSATLPTVELIDVRGKKKQGRWISDILRQAIGKTLEKKEQSLLFLNRRGYSPLLLCHACGHHMECPSCSTWLVYHKSKNTLQCHYCDYKTRPPSTCPECEETETLSPCGPGVERVAEEVETLFPDARLCIMTSDTLSTPKKISEHIQAIQNHDVDIIIGTQVMAKGHHFPLLSLVGVVDGDLGLSGADLRAAEKTYQLLSQVSGRAGRSERTGTVLIQTHCPEHPVMHALKNYDHKSFLSLESSYREQLELPPFGKLASVIISGKDEKATEQWAQTLAIQAPQHPDITIMGPTQAPLYQIHHWYRWRFLIKGKKKISLQKVLDQWLSSVEIPSTMKVTTDIDPYSFF